MITRPQAKLKLIAKFFEIDDLYILCTPPPACLLFRQDNLKHIAFEDLKAQEMPVFPIEGFITVKRRSIRRKQVPICSGFSLTDYKVQVSIVKIAVLDLKHDPTINGQTEHRRFCSPYVQLSWVESLHRLHLLQPIEMNDLKFRAHKGLLAEMEGLRKLEEKTIRIWARQ